MTRGWAIRNPSTAGPDRTRQRSVPTATMSAIGDSPRRMDTSPKKSPATDPGPLRAIDDDPRLALEDDVEAGPGHPLAEDPLAVRVDRLLERVDHPLELRIREVGEQAEAGDGVDQIVESSHGSRLLVSPW